MVDLSKYSIEKFVHFVPEVIPGFIALLTFQLSAPGRFAWFFGLGFLGYGTKLGLILLAAFLVGHTMTASLAFLVGAVGGVTGVIIGRQPYKPAHSFDVAPWRDPRWRMFVRSRLGVGAPNDTRPMTEQTYGFRRKMIDLMPQEQRSVASAALESEKIQGQMDDGNWESWYDHYHKIILRQSDRDFVSLMQKGLNFSLQTAALYLLIGATFVPGVRHWWCILPASLWVLFLLGEVNYGLHRFMDKWSTLDDQIKYLSESESKPESA